jgi:hypothetical protein
MVRYWQAFQSVEDAQYPYLVERTMSVSKAVVQIRLSTLIVTTVSLSFAIIAAYMAYLLEPLVYNKKHLHLPDSHRDWIELALDEYRRYNDLESARSSGVHAEEHRDFFLAVKATNDRQPVYIKSAVTCFFSRYWGQVLISDGLVTDRALAE